MHPHGGSPGQAEGAPGAGRPDWLTRREARPQRPAWPTLKRAFALNRPHLATVLLLMGAIAISALVGLGPPLVMKRIVDDAILADLDRAQLDILLVVLVAFV